MSSFDPALAIHLRLAAEKAETDEQQLKEATDLAKTNRGWTRRAGTDASAKPDQG